MFKIIYQNKILIRIYQPVFSYSGSSIFKQFRIIIHLLAGRRYNFHDPVRCSLAPSVIQFICIADNRNIRFNVGI